MDVLILHFVQLLLVHVRLFSEGACLTRSARGTSQGIAMHHNNAMQFTEQ
jgi:hypothetical protein